MTDDTHILTDVKSYLEWHVEGRKLLGAKTPKGLMFASIEEFILTFGREWTAAPLPEEFERGEIKQCFKNCSGITLHREDLRYVEGFAMGKGLFPVHHAWLVDADGNVIDPTWPEPETAEYFGVVIPNALLWHVLTSRGRYCVLDNWEQNYPLLQGKTEIKP